VEKGIKKSELETVIISKVELTEEDEIKKEYYYKIEENRKNAFKYFKNKDYPRCYASI
jgi:hypothetical protein